MELQILCEAGGCEALPPPDRSNAKFSKGVYRFLPRATLPSHLILRVRKRKGAGERGGKKKNSHFLLLLLLLTTRFPRDT